MESDPLGIKAGLNTYSYADSDALGKMDASGLKVMVCAGRPETLPHSWLCVGARCGGLVPRPGEAFGWNEGVVSPEDFIQPRSVCMEYRPRGVCDQTKFEKCVLNNIRGFGGTSTIYHGFGRNCFHWGDQVLKDCSAMACRRG